MVVINIDTMENNLSIVIPCFNEEKNILQLLTEISESFSETKIEVILVDDHSSIPLKNFVNLENFNFEIIILRNEYTRGQTYSIKLGIKNSNYDVIGLMDGDCQNPPSELFRLWKEFIKNDLDAALSFRKNRKDNYRKRISSFFGNRFSNFLTKSKLRDMGSSLKIVKKNLMVDILFDGDLHRFIGPILEFRNYKISEFGVEHRDRLSGHSNYGIGRIAPVLIDSVLFYLSKGFTKPLRYALGRVSLYMFLFSSILLLVTIFQKIVLGNFIHTNPLFLISLFGYLLSIQVFTFGILKNIEN